MKIILKFFYISFLSVFFLLSTNMYAGEIKIREGKSALKINANNYNELSFSNTFTELTYKSVKTEKGIFYELSIPDYGYSNHIGDPKLPMLRKLIEIPFGATVNVKVVDYIETEYKLSDYGISEKLMPAQPPVSKDLNKKLPDFEYNSITYSSNQYNSDDLVDVNIIGTMRGVRIGRLDIAPVRYNPVTNTIKIYNDIKVEITFNDADITKTMYEKKKNYSPYFESMYSNQLVNYKTSAAKDALTTYPVKYVIVSPITFQSQLQPFIQWKTKKGFKVIEAYTNDSQVGTTTTSIKNYLKNLYDNATPSDPAPTFVLLVGDVAEIPSFSGNTGSHVSDLYYCEYTGDYLPEIYYGRFSASTTVQLQPQIDKTLEYEQYLMPDPSYLGKCVMIAGQDATYGPLHGDGQINYGTSTYFNIAHGLTSSTYLYSVSGSSATTIRQNISDGVCYANYTAHGSSDGWYDPQFSISQIASLANAHKYPLMVGNCCLTNTFDGDCFGEELLRASNKGAVGYIGGSNTTTWDEDFWWGTGYKTVVVNPTYSATSLGAYDRTFHDHSEARSEWYASQDQMVFAGNLAVTQSGSSEAEYYWEIYHLMGDPSLMIYFGVPAQLDASYTPLIPLGSSSFTVNTEPWAYVAVSMANVLHGAALADSNGVATINIDPFTIPGKAYIVATKQNRAPFIDSLDVASPTGPYVIYTSNTLHDATGNNNGLADFGENITLDITLQNVGQAIASNVTAKLRTNDTYITITDSTATWGTITNGLSSTQNNAFAFTVANYVPDQHIVHFTIVVTDGSNTWNVSFNVVLNAPLLSIGDITIDDNATGNGNGRLDIGENANIIISSTNIGHSDAINSFSNLSLSEGDATIINANTNLGTLNAISGASNATFNITVNPTAVNGSILSLNNTLTSGLYSAQKPFNLMIGIVDEDWETGDITKFDWEQSTYPWVILNTLPYEGIYSAKSGTIPNQENSDISITFNVLADDSISFYAKVSSESNYDFLKFYINDVEAGSWSGEMGWTRQVFPVTPGTTTFKWSYIKDYSMSNGDDCAWIDYILFPPIAISSLSINDVNIGNNAMTCFPNPFTYSTTINYSIEKTSNVKIKVFDTFGQEIETLANDLNKPAGNYSLTFNAEKYKAGIYHCILTTNDKTITRKLILK